MQKLISALSLLTISLSLTSCGSNTVVDSIDKEARISDVSTPFSFDYPTTSATYDFFSQGDSLTTLLAASPYYLGAETLPLPAFQQFEALKTSKIAEAADQTQILWEKSQTLNISVDEFTQPLLELMSIVATKEPKVKPYLKAVTAELAQYYTTKQILTAQYNALNQQSISDQFTVAFIGYQKTSLSFDLAEKVIGNLNHLLANSAAITLALAGHPDQDLNHAVSLLETNMESISSINPQVDAVNDSMVRLQNTLDQITTADQYFGLASIEFIQKHLPELQQKIATITPTEILTIDDIATLSQYGKLFDTFSNALKQNLETVPTHEIVENNAREDHIVTIAYADESSYLEKSYQALKASAQVATSGVNLAWQGAKQTFQVAQTAAGVTLDTLSAATQSTLDIGYNMLGHGGKLRNIPQDIRNNFYTIKENYTRGVSGATTFKNAEEYLNRTETTAQDLFETGTSQYLGQSKPASKITWISGQIARLTVGMFTGFGKGIFKVANPQSTPGEYLDGTLDIAFSFIGGSKALVKGAQAVTGFKEGATLAGKSMIISLQRLGNSLKSGVLKRDLVLFLEQTGQTLEQALKSFPSLTDLEKTKILSTTLQKAAQDIQKNIALALQDGGKTVWGNIVEGVPNAYHEFIKETFEKSSEGIKTALTTIVGKSSTDFFDNVTGAALDDLVKGAIKDAVDTSLVLVSYDGTFSGALLLEGWPFPVSITISGSEVTGTIATSIDFGELFDGESDPIVFNGAITGAVTSSGQLLGTFQGAVSGADKPTTFTGSFNGQVNEQSLSLDQIKAQANTDKRTFGPYSGQLSKIGSSS